MPQGGRLNISWNLWLLIIQPRMALERFLQFDTLFLAFGIVALGGLVQGTTLALRIEGLMPVMLRVLGRRSLEPLGVALWSTVAFVAAWLALSWLYTAFARLVEVPVQARTVFTVLGLAGLPWLFEALLLPMVLVEAPGAFGALDTVAKAAAALWWLVLHWIALSVALETSRRRRVAIFMLAAYTLMFAVQIAALIAGLALGTTAL